ncbi:HMA2 domain-containing protein [Sulfurospirillum multivorans]|uniref:Cation transporter n=2 Tax=Sulfurospirillum multivorans TaxID=66821 RepID=A0AA86E3N0_SULMK|nr:hypothetical protein [Sulfurospirillum multivorans]AHJ13992.1 hypothetical protein SMUL_2753 [Sulfurospirillum multivorans DSM 12446]QEH07480.1 hypothetical protein SMN_2725 [Sulfurospirillum multivorans]
MNVTAEKLVELGSYFSIVHHIKGRIRLRVSPKIKEHKHHVGIEDIEALPARINGIKSIKINKMIGSLTIEYDSAIFPDHLWENLVKGEKLDEIITIIDQLAKEIV